MENTNMLLKDDYFIKSNRGGDRTITINICEKP